MLARHVSPLATQISAPGVLRTVLWIERSTYDGAD